MKKVNILLPIAGRGQRFVDQGYVMPKPLIMVNEKHMIDWALSSINIENCNLIFVVRDEHINNFSIDQVLKHKFGNDVKVVSAKELTQGTICSCLLAKNLINNDSPLLIYCPDVCFENQLNPYEIKKELDGLILTFKSNNPAYSYVQIDDNGKAIRTAEKSVISSNAAVGVYYFNNGSTFVHYAEEMIKKNLRTNNEFYVCPLYNLLIEKGLNVGIEEVEKMHVIGTPEELDFFTTKSTNRFGKKPVALCCDHSGFELKELAKKILSENNFTFIDYGTFINKDCDYSDYVNQATKSINDGLCNFGIGFCRSGQGINISANKVKGIRAAWIHNEYMAEFAIRHNCANFFSIPSKYVNEEVMKNMIKVWSETTFDGGRHQIRISKLE